MKLLTSTRIWLNISITSSYELTNFSFFTVTTKIYRRKFLIYSIMTFLILKCFQLPSIANSNVDMKRLKQIRFNANISHKLLTIVFLFFMLLSRKFFSLLLSFLENFSLQRIRNNFINLPLDSMIFFITIAHYNWLRH